jgi:hypothetical protein
MGIKT